MKRSRLFVWAAALLLTVGIIGCTGFVEKLKAGIDTAIAVKNDAKPVLKNLEEQAAKLPVGDPVRVAIEEKIAKVKGVLTQTDGYLETASATLNSIQKGEVTPDLSAALSMIPYGAYVGLGLSAVLALYKTLKVNKTTDALRKVVQSWHEVGEDLSPDEKSAVSVIQGPDVTKLVHQIKADIVSK